jgi:predicted HicB family RNase H-like nuclease
MGARSFLRMPREKTDAVKLVVRLPPDVHAALVKAAADNDRSLNGQVIAVVRAALMTPASARAPLRGRTTSRRRD